jgi:hypothetical protein
MALTGNLSPRRMLFVVLASPAVGGFAWGILHPPNGWENFTGRLLNGVLAVPMTFLTMLARPDKVPSWAYIAAAFLVLCLVAIRWPRAAPVDRS